tara:strand:+ start:213 stop:635 length:423 start_codon:yes stop_codon:yes gene_type:complete
MNDNATAWVDALRSGGYAQGIGSLKFDGKFCCLGVACDLFMKSEGRGVWDRRDNERASWFQVLDENGEVTVGDSSDVYLPEEVKEWLGLSNAEGKFTWRETIEKEDYHGNDSLIDLNDNDSSFEDIANIIEQEPEGLFSS